MYESYIYSTENGPKIHSQNVTRRPQATWWHFTVQQEPAYTLVRCTVVASEYIKCHISSQLNHRTFLSVATSIPLGSTEGILWPGTRQAALTLAIQQSGFTRLCGCYSADVQASLEKKTHSLWIWLSLVYVCSERAYIASPSAVLRGMIMPHITASATSSLRNENPTVIWDMHCINFFFIFHPLFEVDLSQHGKKRSHAKAKENALDLRNSESSLTISSAPCWDSAPTTASLPHARGNCFAFPPSHTRASDGRILHGSKQKILQTHTQKCFLGCTVFFVL